MRVLVIGGTLFMGLSAVERLAAQGHEVTVFHRGNRCALVPPEVGHIHGHRDDLTSFRSEIASFSPDAVLDMALEKGSDARERVVALKSISKRLIAVSSANVYRSYSLLHRWESEDEPYRGVDKESGPLRRYRIPEDEDHDEKIDVEQVVMNADSLLTTVMRLPAVHGRNDPLHRGYEYLWRMDEGRPHIVLNDVFGSWRWSRGYVDNMVDALLLVLESDSAIGKTYNVCDPVAMSQAEWIAALGEAAGWKGEVISTDLAPAQSEQDYRHHFLMDSTAIRQELGYTESVGTREWIQRTVDWLRANPPSAERAAEIRKAATDFDVEDSIAAQLRAKH